MIGRSIMGQSYSLDLRARIVGHVRAGHSRRDAARHFRVSESCAVKLLKRADRTGSVEPAHRGRPRGSGKLAAHQAFLIGRVEAQPAITMPELAAALEAERGVIVSPAMAHQPLAAVFGVLAGVAGEEGGDLGLDGLRQQGSGALAQNLGQRVGERSWLDQLDDIILAHGVSLLWWRSGGSNTPTIRRLNPSRRHQLPPIAPAKAPKSQPRRGP